MNTAPEQHTESSPRGDMMARALDRALVVQRPAARAFARRLRRTAPNATPQDLLTATERWYRRTAMGTGGGVGAASAIPGIGTVSGIALVTAEVVSFLDLTALYALTVAEIHGDAAEDPQRARALVLGIMLGDSGRKLITEFAKNRAPQALLKSAAWGELVTEVLPQPILTDLTQRLTKQFLTRFATRHAGATVGKLLPFGIGATVGALGNRALANQVIHTSQTAFGPAPAWFTGDLSDEQLAQQDVDNRRLSRRERKRLEKDARKQARKQLRSGSN